MLAKLFACHLAGRLVQSDWVREARARSLWVAAAYAAAYALCFLPATRSWVALAAIAAAHLAADRSRLVRRLCWIRDFLAPRRIAVEGEARRLRNLPWAEHKGSPPGRPPWESALAAAAMDAAVRVLAAAAAVHWL